jgi:UPF0288 family protein (methanogenesis marker protein 3)
MTKKDYILIAQALHEVRPPRDSQYFQLEIETWTSVIGNLMVHLKAADPAFNSDRFIIACERGQLKHA